MGLSRLEVRGERERMAADGPVGPHRRKCEN